MREYFLLNEKKITRSLANVRAARGGDNPPMIITIPKNIANAFNLTLGETLDILTDGEKIVLKRTEITKL
jgi:AbrB family looped-hinge helix DNA binding protein